MSPGEVLAGKYRVERVLAEGTIARVVAARHLALDQMVALKLMLPEAVSDAIAVRRFLREARLVAQLRGEHATRVLDVGVLEEGPPFIVMELLEGEDLRLVLERVRRLEAPFAADLALQACEGLAEAHRLGIVHRDIKPANLFLTSAADGAPLVKLLDFGISKANLEAAGVMSTRLTASQKMLGSPAYMSPEQIISTRDVDARTDIWALGVLLFRAISGRLPFDAPSAPELCGRILYGAAPPLTEAFPAAPPGIGAVVDRCLARDREARYTNLADLAEALAPFAGPDAAVRARRVRGILGFAPAPVLQRERTPGPELFSTTDPDPTPRDPEPPPPVREIERTRTLARRAGR